MIVTLQTTEIIEHFERPGRFRITSGASWWAIEHDKCCREYPNGHMCDLATMPTAYKRECELEWERAKTDVREHRVFTGTWIYSQDENPVEVTFRSARLASALALDVSVSMEWASGSIKGKRKVDAAFEAADVYARGAQDGECLSVSTFAGEAWTPIKMSPHRKAHERLKDVSREVRPATNIGAGLEMGFTELLRPVPECEGPTKVAILLSDGVNNRGEWTTVVEKFRRQGWKIFTVGFLTDETVLREVARRYPGAVSDADYQVFSKTLIDIAARTGGVYYPAGGDNVDHIFDRIRNLVNRESSLLYVSEWLKVGAELAYDFYVDQTAELLRVFTAIGGSKLGTTLVSPSGEVLGPGTLTGDKGRYQDGLRHQTLEVNRPTPGRWSMRVGWVDPPAGDGQQVNISVTERSPVVANLLAFKPAYKPGEPVDVLVHVAARERGRDASLVRPRVKATIQKPHAELIRAVEAQAAGWVMHKEVILDSRREIVLHDDGGHGDYQGGDGTYGNSFRETEQMGPYLVTVEISGLTPRGNEVKKTLRGAFQVGPISKNRITVSRGMEWLQRVSGEPARPGRGEAKTPQRESDDLLKQPKELEKLLEGPKKAIEDLLK